MKSVTARDHARGTDVAAEDLAVQAEADHALLDPRTAGVVDADQRAADLGGQVHHLDDLLAEDLAQAAAEDGEVLREHAHLAAVDGAEPGHHAVAVRAVAVQAEAGRPVPGELVQLGEGALVQQQRDPLAGGLLAAGMLLLHRALRPGVHGLVEPLLEVGDLPGGRVDVHRLSHKRAAYAPVRRTGAVMFPATLPFNRITASFRP